MCATLVLAATALVPIAASASERVTYGYDAKARLTQISHTGSVNNGLTATYAYEAAGTRTSTTTSGATQRVVVVPLNGITVISMSGS